MNVFEDQRFLLRSRAPDGSAGDVRKLSWADIMTGPDEPLSFDYALEYMNVAALGLCVSLTQAFLEPASLEELIDRLETPVPRTELEAIIGDNREKFGIDEGFRFMQGPEPERDKKGRLKTGDLSEVILTIKKGDKEFLNRPASGSVVSADQIPLLLFSRSTFFEKSAGRGYKTGTTGDLEIRTYLIDPTSLRRTIWLNVLATESLPSYFQKLKPHAYDNWMWIALPELSDVPQGGISLRSGLFWTVANLWVEIEELEEPRACLVTGDTIEAGESAGTGVVVNSTGIGFGTIATKKEGIQVRQSFFAHPNAPYKIIPAGKDRPKFDCHLEVEENSGLIGQMGGLFYAASNNFRLAPVIDQLYALHDLLEEEYDQDRPARYNLLCFGFHMLSSKKNVHGGYESELFTYPVLGGSAEDRTKLMETAEHILKDCAEEAKTIDDILRQAVQRCIMKEVNVKENESGAVTFKESSRISDSGILRDTSHELWRHAGEELRGVLNDIGSHCRTAEELELEFTPLLRVWTKKIYQKAERIFHRYFQDYSASPQHLLAAHDARRLFYARIRNLTYSPFLETETSPNTTLEESNG